MPELIARAIWLTLFPIQVIRDRRRTSSVMT